MSIILSKKKKKKPVIIGFYNLENLFDTSDDKNTFDDDFTPAGKKHWNYRRYHKKIKKLSSVISQIGTDKSKLPPVLMGVVEVENKVVLDDLVNHKNLAEFDYGYAHFDSPDERGIDVALLYQKKEFELLASKTYPLLLSTPRGERDYTRDVLYVKGRLNGELMYVLVNHWPSRRSGKDTSETNRIKAAELVGSIVASIQLEDPLAYIMIMGDFNDDPTNKSIKQTLLSNTSLHNPMESLLAKGKGSLSHKRTWHLFDQIIFTKNFFDKTDTGFSFRYADVFNKNFVKIFRGKYKGTPFRTYVGKWYKGGFSDHFPVYIFLNKG